MILKNSPVFVLETQILSLEERLGLCIFLLDHHNHPLVPSLVLPISLSLVLLEWNNPVCKIGKHSNAVGLTAAIIPRRIKNV